MELKKRWYRKFNLDVDAEKVKAAIAAATDPAVYTKISLAGPHTPDDVDSLTGKTFTFVTDTKKIVFEFHSKNGLRFTEDGGETKECYVDVKTLDEEVYFVNHLVPGYEWARQITLILDTKNGCGTVVDAHFGTEHSNIDVSREFLFGKIEELYNGAELHDFTNELLGKAIEWEYSERIMRIKHIYNSNLYYTYGAMAPNGAWLATNPANYVKIRDDIFLFSFVEERQAGLQGLFMIDLTRMHDLGSFFGVSEDHMTSACVGAKGYEGDMLTIF